jgi:phosphoserine phosphatase
MDLSAFLERHTNHAGATPPLAVFDCDGTVIRGDIGESMLYYQLEEFLFKTSPAEVWPGHPQRDSLDRLFHAAASVGAAERKDHPGYRRFADAVLGWYFDQLATGDVASITAGCADIVRLWAGFTHAEVRGHARANLLRELETPFGKKPLGSHTVTRGARFLRESRLLLEKLLHAGFQVWAVSGSSTWSVEPVFEALGVPPERVLGIGLSRSAGILTAEVPEPVPVHEGKVRTLRGAGLPAPVLTASDSPLDLPLLRCSSDLMVFVNTRYPSSERFFTELKIEQDSRWVIINHPTDETCPTPQ